MMKKEGFHSKPIRDDRKGMIKFINLQLSALGQPQFADDQGMLEELMGSEYQNLTKDLVSSFREKSRLLANHLSPVDLRIQNFIDDYLSDVKLEKSVRLPNDTFVLNQKGLARELSLPPNGNVFKNKLVSSYRVKQGILNNPLHDKRTTKGTFHIVEGGLPVPLDKKEVPKIAFANLLHEAINAPDEYKKLPFTANQEENAHVMLSLLMRPIVCPKVEGVIEEKSMEVRFFAPGCLASNLDFVEKIFGNAGDHNLVQNDSALDVKHWTGTTGCIILAPQLINCKKKDLGLPHILDATERQKRDGMCWENENELYNDGGAFKITCRDDRGVVVTLIADNYYGYSKKEIKTQLSYSANLYGLAEEEHAGGAIAFPRGVMGENVYGKNIAKRYDFKYNFKEAMQLLGDRVDMQEQGYAIDKKYPHIVYIPETANFDIAKNSVYWQNGAKEQSLKLSPYKTYVYPSGDKFDLEKHPSQQLWRMIHTSPEGMFCHKPSTVSGGGKSEISKSLLNAIQYRSFNIIDIEKDFQLADEIINKDYSTRWKNIRPDADPSRGFLDQRRTLGSAVKLLTPSDQYSDEYNHFLREMPHHIRTLVLFVKRLYRNVEEKGNWKDYMTVEVINGKPGTTLMFKNKPVLGSYVRIGFNKSGNWLVHKLRSDFVPSHKIQLEDDISASIVIPSEDVEYLNPEYTNKSVKVVANCEAVQFQRPDEAIIRGYDVGAEADIVEDGTFLTNYEPMTKADAIELVEDAINFDKYTQPVKDLITDFIDSDDEFFVTPSHTRLVDGLPTNNPRYQQKNIFYHENKDSYLAEIGVRLTRKIESEKPAITTVNAVLPGRRNNPADKEKGIRPLSVFNPIHYQELPELFMDFICSLTGKSPSTTGAGSEGALTKGPFNMLSPTTDLNNALLSYILTGYEGFNSAAGYVGKDRFDHDISLLIPEIWARLVPEDRDPKLLIETGCLEKMEDFEYEGKKILGSRLGYRITQNFAFRCMNRLFDNPLAVFTEEMLKPELQSMEEFVDGINNIVEAQQRVALAYFEDGSVEAAIPPLKVLLHIMAYGHYEGKDLSDPSLRELFDRNYVINSDWYKERLKLKQEYELKLNLEQLASLTTFASKPENQLLMEEMEIEARKEYVEKNIEHLKTDEYIKSLVGTIGKDKLHK